MYWCACVPDAEGDAGLGDGVGGVHREEGEHQQDLHDEDDVGVVLGPPIHFRAAEAGDGQHVAPHEEDHAGHEDAEGEPFEGPDHHVVQPAEVGGKHAVRTKEAIKQNLEDLDVDQDEADVDEDVHHPGHGADHHLGLAQGDAGHGRPAFSRPVGQIEVATQLDVAADGANPAGKEEDRSTQQQGKDQLSDEVGHAWFVALGFAFVELGVDQALQAFEFLVAQFPLFLTTKHGNAHVPLRIEVQVVQQELQFLVGGEQSIVQAVAFEELSETAFTGIEPFEEAVQFGNGGVCLA